MDETKVGNYLQALRKKKGLTQQEIADIFEVSNKTVSKWECGQALPELPLLRSLANFYDVSVDDILNGERKEVIDFDKSKRINDNYFFFKNFKKLRLFTLLAYLSLALSFILFLVLVYTTYTQAIGSFVGAGSVFIPFVIICIGVFLYGETREDVDIKLKNKKRRYLYFTLGGIVTIIGFILFITLYTNSFVYANTKVVKSYITFDSLGELLKMDLFVCICCYIGYVALFFIIKGIIYFCKGKDKKKIIKDAFKFFADHHIEFFIILLIYTIVLFMPYYVCTSPYAKDGTTFGLFTGGYIFKTVWFYLTLALYAASIVLIIIFRKNKYCAAGAGLLIAIINPLLNLAIIDAYNLMRENSPYTWSNIHNTRSIVFFFIFLVYALVMLVLAIIENVKNKKNNCKEVSGMN